MSKKTFIFGLLSVLIGLIFIFGGVVLLVFNPSGFLKVLGYILLVLGIIIALPGAIMFYPG